MKKKKSVNIIKVVAPGIDDKTLDEFTQVVCNVLEKKNTKNNNVLVTNFDWYVDTFSVPKNSAVVKDPDNKKK